MIQDMKTTLTRLFTVALLMMVSMGAKADVKVLYGESGNDTFTGGKISATQEVQKDGQVAVTFTIKPDNGYTFTYTKTSLVIVSVYDPSSKSSTRADEVNISETLWPKGTEGTISYPNYGEYTVTVDPNLGVWVQTLVFTESGAKSDPPVTRSDNIWGMFYLANNNRKNNGYDYKGYNNSNNFYLRSAEFYWNSDNDTPYLTTFQTGQDDVALWIVEKVENTDYYTFKQKDGEGYKYLTVNNAPTGSSNHRKRVHLETITTVTDKNYFTIELITTQDGICGYSIGLGKDDYLAGTTNRYLNPAGGNINSLNGGADRDGIIGFYTKGEIGSDSSGSIWFFEVPKPVIYIDGNNKLMFSCKNEDVTYHYTIDGDDPIATDANTYDESADNILPEGVHTIKVIAVMNSGNTGYASGVVTQEVTIFSTEHPYLISNNQSAWTVGSETKNVFYMIPSDNNTVNTTSMPRPTMEWNISLAEEVSGVRYFYICNTMTDCYLYRSGNNVSMKTSLEKTELEAASDNGFKFYVIKRAAGTYHAGYSIVPYGETSKYVNKNSGNAEANALAIATNENDYSRWNFVAKDEVLNDPVLPFATSGEGTSSYYQIQNGKMDSDNIPYYIIPPASIPGNAAASKSEEAATVKSGSWYFMKVQDPVLENSDPSQIDWLAYYKVVNAETGKVLYYSFTANNSPCIKVGDYVENDGNYMFAFVKSPTTDYYYIVPKTVKDNQLANISCFWRDGSNMKPATTRKNDNNIWKFAAADLFCNDLEFVEEDGKIRIKCNTNAAKIYINTESNADPTSESTLYNPTDPNNATTQNWAITDKVRIKAIAIVSDGATPTPNTASSSVLTLLNKPDITLTEGGNPVTDETYTYDGTAKKPTVSEVSIGEESNKTSATDGTDFETVESTDYNNNINAGTAKVTLRDKASNVYVWHAEKEFNINPKEVGLTWNPDDSGQTTFTYSGLAQAPTVMVTTTDLIGTDECAVTVTVTADQGSSLTNDKAINVGSYTATAFPENTNYKLPDASKTRPFTITRAPVTVTADDKTMGFGDSEPVWTATVTGMVNNENPNLITYTVSCVHGNENGTYDIIPSGAAEQGNYTVTYVKGTLTINAIKPLNKDDAGTPADGITIDVTYNGTAYQVVVTHKKAENDYVLVQGNDKDYTWSVASNTDPNHPEYDVVTVTGHGNYTGEAKAIYIRLTFYDTTPNNDTDGPETAAAYYATQNLQLSGGIEAWYVTNLENNTLTFEKVKVVEGENEISYLPENQPVLLFGDPSSTGFMLKPYTGTIMEIPATGEGSNILKMVTENAGKAVNLGEVYVFSKGEFVLTMAGTLTKGKVYLDNPSYNSSSLSRGTLSASRGETTGINDVQLSINDQFNNVWHALDGQKFNKKPTRKGIYLQNGKKVVIK